MTQFDTAETAPVLTVSELNRMARRALESQLPLLWVEGEISNFTRAASGHWYFSLKDDQAQVRCVMFRGRNQFADFTPANGDHVEIRALPSLYEARGDFQLGAETIRRAGAGKLFEAFLRLKSRLESEGLFDAARKRALPRFPRTLGVVTSLQAAALRDVLTALARRMPGLRIILYPAPVQGAGAAPRLAGAIQTASARADCDVLLVVRGGGSLEDLWPFNEESVVRAIAAAAMPVVSGVGHETDFTLADFAADLRAPTPTAAAELASPHRDELLGQLATLARQLAAAQTRSVQDASQRLDHLSCRLLHPAEQLRLRRAALELVSGRLLRAAHAQQQRRLVQIDNAQARLASPACLIRAQQHGLSLLENRLVRARSAGSTRRALTLDHLTASLAHLDPRRVLARGYSLVQRADGTVVQDVSALKPGETISLRFHSGRARATVVSTTPD
ncbi:MAG: exodeoxyribonuclease VII large subunit [Thiobacillus sp.]